MITWYAFAFSGQQLLKLNEQYHLEHIYSKKRQEMEGGLKAEESLDSLGNKILLEESINVKASDYRFEDKKKIYTGENRRSKNNDVSKIAEVASIVELSEFGEEQIIQRSASIIDEFFKFLEREDLVS